MKTQLKSRNNITTSVPKDNLSNNKSFEFYNKTLLNIKKLSLEKKNKNQCTKPYISKINQSLYTQNKHFGFKNNTEKKDIKSKIDLSLLIPSTPSNSDTNKFRRNNNSILIDKNCKLKYETENEEVIVNHKVNIIKDIINDTQFSKNVHDKILNELSKEINNTTINSFKKSLCSFEKKLDNVIKENEKLKEIVKTKTNEFNEIKSLLNNITSLIKIKDKKNNGSNSKKSVDSLKQNVKDSLLLINNDNFSMSLCSELSDNYKDSIISQKSDLTHKDDDFKSVLSGTIKESKIYSEYSSKMSNQFKFVNSLQTTAKKLNRDESISMFIDFDDNSFKKKNIDGNNLVQTIKDNNQSNNSNSTKANDFYKIPKK